MRRKHSTEFKSKVAIEAIKGEYTIQEIAQRYEIHPNMVTLWKKQLLENAAAAFDKNKTANKEMQRIVNKEEELYSQIGKLKVENEFLKKSTNRFTKRSIASGTKKQQTDNSQAV